MASTRWACAADYHYLAGADRAGIAWEWLRRNADYRQWADGIPRPAPRYGQGTEIFDDPPTALRWGLVFR